MRRNPRKNFPQPPSFPRSQFNLLYARTCRGHFGLFRASSSAPPFFSRRDRTRACALTRRAGNKRREEAGARAGVTCSEETGGGWREHRTARGGRCSRLFARRRSRDSTRAKNELKTRKKGTLFTILLTPSPWAERCWIHKSNSNITIRSNHLFSTS